MLKVGWVSFVWGVVINILLFTRPLCIHNPAVYLKPLELLFSILLVGFSQLKISLTGYFLGFFFTLGLCNSFLTENVFWWYLCVLMMFHLTEFVTTGLTNPANLSFDSFLVNHSWEYAIAALVSWLEFYLESWLFPASKQVRYISMCGVAMCVVGELVRKTAMAHAGTNFNHVIQGEHQEEHRLVTTGIYSWCRHPSYVGWLLWSVGTQVVLVNPVCVVGYAAAAFFFFRGRIYVEEYTLIMFFGQSYLEYQKRVPTGIPLIPGYEGPSWGSHRD